MDIIPLQGGDPHISPWGRGTDDFYMDLGQVCVCVKQLIVYGKGMING